MGLFSFGGGGGGNNEIIMGSGGGIREGEWKEGRGEARRGGIRSPAPRVLLLLGGGGGGAPSCWVLWWGRSVGRSVGDSGLWVKYGLSMGYG